METLQLSEQKARELYRSGSKELKTVLEESFGEDFFSQDVTERVKPTLMLVTSWEGNHSMRKSYWS